MTGIETKPRRARSRTGRTLAVNAGWVLVVREDLTAYEREVASRSIMRSAREIHAFMAPRALSECVERMYVLGLDGRNRLMFATEVARGGMHGCAVSARDILRAAVLGGASAIVLVHNHPSGDPTPSMEDVEMTRAIHVAAAIVGCPLVDHVVIGSTASDGFRSLLDLGLIPAGGDQ